jgi:peptidoglycan/xylan/chitin deacetylase (PgdA/CDA1 family)
MLTLQITPLRQPRRIEPYDCQGLKKIRLFFIFSLYCLTSVAAIAADYASVLMYHRFGEDKYPSTNIRIEQFEAHLDFISKGNYTVLPLSKIVDHLQQGLDLPDKTVAITIDDAYQSVFTEARPRLKARNFPYTVFVATQPVDRNQPGYMSWDQIRILQDEGVQIGSQTRTHPHMHEISITEAEEELKISNEQFIKEIGQRPELFAYPFGEYNLNVISLVKQAGFTAAFGQNSGIAHGYNGFFELPRFAMNEQYGSIDRLQLAIDGLPLKVDQIVPEDVVLNNNNNPPNYGFTLAPDIANDRQLRCFNSTYGKLKVYILGPRAEIRLPGALARGRARINCTMPGGDGRWRWFGRQFLVP